MARGTRRTPTHSPHCARCLVVAVVAALLLCAVGSAQGKGGSKAALSEDEPSDEGGVHNGDNNQPKDHDNNNGNDGNVVGDVEGGKEDEEAAGTGGERCPTTIGYEWNGGCWYVSSPGQSCGDLCKGIGGYFNAHASMHSGNHVGMHFFPNQTNTDKAWKSVECSSTDNKVNWGANGDMPDAAWSHPDCYLHCVCSGVMDASVVVESASWSEEFLRRGRIFLSSADLEFFSDFGHEQIFGLRFDTVSLPRNALISRASVQFMAHSNTTGHTAARIHAQRATTFQGPRAFSERKKDLSLRKVTQSYVDWVISDWVGDDAGPAQRTPDISSVIQEVVSSSKWGVGQAIVLLFRRSPLQSQLLANLSQPLVDTNGTAEEQRSHIAESGRYGGAPTLEVEYLAPRCNVRRNHTRLSMELMSDVCGSRYYSGWVPSYHTAINCDSKAFDKDIAQALANEMFRDCKSWCLYSDVDPTTLAWLWVPTDPQSTHDTSGCWRRARECHSITEELMLARVKAEKNCSPQQLLSGAVAKDTPFQLLLKRLATRHNRRGFVVDAEEPRQGPDPYHNATVSKIERYSNHSAIREYFGKHTDYRKFEFLGEGTFSAVFRGRRRGRPKWDNVALKALIYPVEGYKEDREMKMMETVFGGPNVVQLLDVYREPQDRYQVLVMNYIPQPGSYKALFQQFSDFEVRLYLHETLRALDHTHSLGLMHRDVKPNNIVFDPKRRTLNVCDWGSAEFYKPGVLQRTQLGTLIYKAPELLLRKKDYDYKMDLFAVGCIFGAMLFKRNVMFNSNDDFEHFENILKLWGTKSLQQLADAYGLRPNSRQRKMLRGRQYQRTPWTSFVTERNFYLQSPEAWHLLDRLLAVDPAYRYTAREALQHPYLEPIRECWVTMPEPNWQGEGRWTPASSDLNNSTTASANQHPVNVTE